MKIEVFEKEYTADNYITIEKDMTSFIHDLNVTYDEVDIEDIKIIMRMEVQVYEKSSS